MTEQPDTAAIRALYADPRPTSTDRDEVFALCEALDAARVEHAAYRKLWTTVWGQMRDRAESAEAHLAQVAGERHRAEARNERLTETIAFERQANERNCSELLAAEARITAALAIPAGHCDLCDLVGIRIALTGDTE